MPDGSGNIVMSLIGTTGTGFNLFLGGEMARGKVAFSLFFIDVRHLAIRVSVLTAKRNPFCDTLILVTISLYQVFVFLWGERSPLP